MRKTIRRIEAEADPYLLWNTFISVLASEPDELDSYQRPASLVFWYESEVQNGGHLQYFLNRPQDPIHDTREALQALGASDYARILEGAAQRWSARSRTAPGTSEEYVDEAVAGEFDEFDAAYYAASPTIMSILEKHLSLRESDFINLVD